MLDLQCGLVLEMHLGASSFLTQTQVWAAAGNGILQLVRKEHSPARRFLKCSKGEVKQETGFSQIVHSCQQGMCVSAKGCWKP